MVTLGISGNYFKFGDNIYRSGFELYFILSFHGFECT